MDNFDNKLTFMDALLYAMEGENPSKAIENQEKRGQRMVVANQRLPKKTNDHCVPDEYRFNGIKDGMSWEERNEITSRNNREYTKNQYDKMGIEIISEYDDLFYSVKLPEGWEIKATDHSMWNDLFDNKGRKRANFFYKAAFYDRDAFINFDTRFHLQVGHVADPSENYEIWSKSDFQGEIKDGEMTIFETKTEKCTGDYQSDEIIKDVFRKELISYMEEHYPDYEDIDAYWD